MNQFSVIAGLGNPGTQYEFTPHNVGFLVIDELLRRHQILTRENERGFASWEIQLSGHKLWLLKPLRYMNRSGGVIGHFLEKKALDKGSLLVIHDDVDLAWEQIKLKKNSGSGGHRGIQSIIDLMGKDFHRLKLGVGRGSGSDTTDYVLENKEEKEFDALVKKAADGVEALVNLGWVQAANQLNG